MYAAQLTAVALLTAAAGAFIVLGPHWVAYTLTVLLFVIGICA